MKTRISTQASLQTLLGVFLLTTTIHAEPADYVFAGGKVYTVNEKQPWAEAVAVDDNKIVYVGDTETAKKYIGNFQTVVLGDPSAIDEAIFQSL